MEILLGGYMWLFIHRLFECYPLLGDLQIERIYMLAIITYWLIAVRKQLIPNRLNVAFLMLIAALLISWMVSPYAEDGQQTVEDYLKISVFYVLLVTSVRDKHALRRMVMFYLLAMSLYMCHSVREYLAGRGESRMGIWRMKGIGVSYADPNAFAAGLLISLPMVIPFWAEMKKLRGRALLAGYVGLSVGCILLTGSRGAFVGIFFLALLIAMTTRHRVLFLMLMIIATPVGWACLPEKLHQRFETLIDPSVGPANAQNSAEGRVKGFNDGMMLLGQSPLVGFGPHSFGQAVGHGFQAHNLYGQTAGELGGLGLLALASIIGSFFWNSWEMRRRARGRPADFPIHLSRAVILSVILLLLMGWGGHNLFRFNWLWFGAFQVIALHCARNESAPTLDELGDEHAPKWRYHGSAEPARADGHALAARGNSDLHPV